MIRSLIYFNERPDNLGDVLIYERLATLLQDKGYDVYVFGMPLRSRDGVKQILGRIGVNMFILRSVIMGKKVFLFSSPGGPVFEKEYEWNLGSLLLRVYKSFGVRKVFSFSSITTTLGYMQVSRIIGEYDYLLLRDRGSNAYYSSLLLQGKSFLVSDISFYKKQILLRQSKDSPTVGFSFRRYTPEQQDSVTILERALLSSLGNRKYFCQVIEDWTYMREFGDPVHFLTPENYEAFYEALDFVVTNRVHVYLFALQNGCTPIMLTHRNHKKAIDLITDLGLGASIIYNDNEQLDEKLLDKMNTLKDSMSGIKYPDDNLFLTTLDCIV